MMESQSEQRGPRALAEKVSASIVHLQQQISTATEPKETKRLRRLLRIQRDALAWCKSRQGY